MKSATLSERTTAIITGGNRGLGFHAAAALAADPARAIVLAVRDIEHGRHAAKAIQTKTGNADVTARALDLSSLASVRTFAADLAGAGLPPIGALLCNAGVQIVGATRATVDGFEETFAVNHLGHFLLVHLLLPQLTAAARIVIVASGTHDPARWTGMPPARYQSPQRLAEPSDSDSAGSASSRGRVRYTTSKLCNVMFAYELHRRLRGGPQPSAVSVNAFDPGAMPGAGLARDWPTPVRAFWNGVMPAAVPLLRGIGLPFSSPRRSGTLLARVAADDAYADVSGDYIELGQRTRSSLESYERAKWAELWEGSARLVGLTAPESPLGAV